MCHFISLMKFIEVAEILLMWFGFCLTYNLHGGPSIVGENGEL